MAILPYQRNTNIRTYTIQAKYTPKIHIQQKENIHYTQYAITTIHYVTDKKWLYNLLENAAGDNKGLSNIKFGKLFHQDVADEQKILSKRQMTPKNVSKSGISVLMAKYNKWIQ